VKNAISMSNFHKESLGQAQHFSGFNSHCMIFYQAVSSVPRFGKRLNIAQIPYILESNPHPVFGDFLNEKKLVRNSNPHLSFNHPLPTG
jgi:hypothetical protein